MTSSNAPAPLRANDLLTEVEAAALLRVKPDTLRAWRTRKRLAGKAPPYIQRGQGRVLYLRADLDAWLRAGRREPRTTTEERR
ncbi:MAG: helix-turn-helix domain-containing protein [Rhodanobacteraceae bacterium]|jgi:hypothetical protein|nr:helix-turn-helix domain-containing protein [Rhodanobacteraceae bacterium]